METHSLNNDNDATIEETIELLKETARIFYTNTDDNITINLYFAMAGVLLAIGALYFIWNSMPSVLSSLANTVAGVAGGVGGGYGRAHLSRHGNKFSGGAGGLPAYEDYDYNYSAGAEHYEAREELTDIIRSDSDTRRSDMNTGASFYSGSYVKPGSHLVQRQIY